MTQAYCRPSSETVAAQVASAYPLPAGLQCQFWVQGMHDNFLIESGADRFIFRLYRPNARSQEDILFELELLDFLHRKGCPVAAPLITRHGQHHLQIYTPAGPHLGALFPYAPGSAPGTDMTPEQSHLLGRTVAEMYHTANSFIPRHSRPRLDLDYLLDDSIRAIDGFLNADQRQQVQQFAGEIRRCLPALPLEAPYFGICSGDINATNFHIDGDSRITLFDFDQCGPGWRAFEIGKFFSSIAHYEQAFELGHSFLQGHTAVRPLEPEEFQAIPSFMLVSLLWVMALHAINVDIIGYRFLEPLFWAKKLTALQQRIDAIAERAERYPDNPTGDPLLRCALLCFGERH